MIEDPGKIQEEGWQQVKRGKKASYNSPNDNNDSQPEKTKEHVTGTKEMNISNPYMALHIEEGEIPAAAITLEGEEIEEGGDLESSALPNSSQDGTEKALTRYSSSVDIG